MKRKQRPSRMLSRLYQAMENEDINTMEEELQRLKGGDSSSGGDGSNGNGNGIPPPDMGGWLGEAMLMACTIGYPKVVECLLKSSHGAEVDVKDDDGMTPLMHASISGNSEVVDLLLLWGALIDDKDNNGRTALMWASEKGMKKASKVLMKSGACVRAKDKEGNTALHLAAIEGHTKVSS